MTTLKDWNDAARPACQSKGGVWAFADYEANLIRAACEWPPAEILQKLYESRQGGAFAPDDLTVLAGKLGYYCDLQSVHSEDAITWSTFGVLSRERPDARVAVLNWLLQECGVPARNNGCDVSLWRRVPHPESNGLGGPELDVFLVGDVDAVMVEAKWLSTEGTGQGVRGDRSQIELRQLLARNFLPRVVGARRPHVLTISLSSKELSPGHQSQGSIHLAWEVVCACPHFPKHDEIMRYYRWKLNKSKVPKHRKAAE